MSHEVIIEIRNLTKVYRDFWGRPKVQASRHSTSKSIEAKSSDCWVPTARERPRRSSCSSGLLFATEGEALIFNEPTTNVAKNERIGYLPEESYLYKFLNAEETLQFYGRLFKMSAAERNKRVSQLIDMVGLTSAKHRQLREYSKGMQRRIGLAQALINNPELILLDEPTSGLDPIGTSEIKHLIRELREQGKTIVLSGHLLADMQDICDRIAILASRRAQGDRPRLRPADRPRRHSDQGAQSEPGGDRGDQRRDSSPRRRRRDGRPPDDNAGRAVPADRPGERAASRPPQGGARSARPTATARGRTGGNTVENLIRLAYRVAAGREPSDGRSSLAATSVSIGPAPPRPSSHFACAPVHLNIDYVSGMNQNGAIGRSISRSDQSSSNASTPRN